MAPPPSGVNTTLDRRPPSLAVNVMVSLPLPGTTKSVARYWSPKAWRPMTIGWVQPGDQPRMFEQMIGSRKMTPPRMLRMVPLGERHIFLRPEFLGAGLVGVIVAHFTPTPAG